MRIRNMPFTISMIFELFWWRYNMITWQFNLFFLHHVIKNPITLSNIKSIAHFILPTCRSRLRARAYWETMWLVPWFDCDESLTWWGLNSSLRRFHCFTFIFVCVENHVCLSCVVQVAGVTWTVAMRIMARIGDLVQRTNDSQAQVGYSVVGWSRGWVTLCAVYAVQKETRSAGFLVEPQNQGRRLLVVWPQKHWDGLSVVGPQNH
jgi:hypothetical protein